MQSSATQSNSGKVKIIRTMKVDNSKPKYKEVDKQHKWTRTDKRKMQ